LKYLLDTNILSELISKTPNQKVIKYILSLNEDDIYISTITIGEIKYGIEILPKSSKKEKLLSWFYDELLERFKYKTIDINSNIMVKWAELSSRLKQIGRPLPVMDSLIGATCLELDYTLITRNEKDFHDTDINIINPF